MATHSSILVWKILWTEEPGSLQSIVSKELGMTEHTNTQYSVYTVINNTFSENKSCYHKNSNIFFLLVES